MNGGEPESESIVETAVLRDLERMPVAVRSLTEAGMAVVLGREMDAGRQLSIAPVSRELRELMEVLRGWAEASGDTGDEVDELAALRAARREAMTG